MCQLGSVSIRGQDGVRTTEVVLGNRSCERKGEQAETVWCHHPGCSPDEVLPVQFQASDQWLILKRVLQFGAEIVRPWITISLSHWLKFSSRRAWPHVKSQSGPWRHKQSDDGQPATVLAAGQLLLYGRRSRVHISLPSTEKMPPSMCQRPLCPVKSLSVHTREQLFLST